MNILIIVVTIYSSFSGTLANENLIVSLSDGLVQGSYRESYDGRKFIAFEGIPYARPPIGNLRFEDPQPVEPWLGVLKAVNTYTCMQINVFQKVYGQEDCLYINVYVPREKINPDEKLDVIVHLHGGAFMVGSPADFTGPDKIMDRDVVYVNLNYRLGPFGFYSLGDGRGNYGLKDQTAALKWVRDNIGKFGGNKDSVTTSGLSAGGASVHLHYFSELSRGLFHKGFSQSGVALNPWVIRANPAINGKKLAAAVGCSDQSLKNLYECMKQRSGQQITQAVLSFSEAFCIPLVPFGPIVEKNSPTAFLKKHPYEQLVDKEMIDVPLLISMTTKEGTIPGALTYGTVDDVNQNYKKWFPLMFEYYEYDKEKQDEISEKIRKFYFKDDPITTKNFDKLIEACTHRLFHLGGDKATRLQAEASKSDIYFFIMNYVGKFVPVVNISGFDIDFGPGHGTDGKFYYSGPVLTVKKLTPDEERMKDILLDMMVSFAKTGIPKANDVDFQRFANAKDLNYLLVNGPDDLHMETVSSLGPHEFWNSLGLKEDENATVGN
uniref:Odorant degrading protein 1 n=1 Tax=Holotrichia parallela TaxID=93412 RepID=A0A2P1ERN2_HOLPA|nr:odorant degrading protein 1 [Holotrichia parallela]